MYVFLDGDGDGDGDGAFTTAPTKITAPTRAEGTGSAHQSRCRTASSGRGTGWLVVRRPPGADAGAGAVFCYARVPLSGPAGTPAFGYAYAQKLTSAAATYGGVTIDSGFGAGVALTGRFLLATRAPSVGRAGRRRDPRRRERVFVVARSSRRRLLG